MERTNKPISKNKEYSQEDKITIRMPLDLKEEMLEYCHNNKVSISEFVRNALINELRGKEEKKSYSVDDLKMMIDKEKLEIEQNKVFLEFTQKLNKLKKENKELLEQAYKIIKPN